MSQLTAVDPPKTDTPNSPPINPLFKAVDDKPIEGTACDRKTLDEGPVVLTMPESLSADSVTEFEYWANGLIQRLRRKSGGHKSRLIETGEQVHIIQHPGCGWSVSSYEWSWTADDGKLLNTARVFAQTLGWEAIEFNSPDEAFAFVQGKIKTGEAPGKPRKR